MFDDAIMGTGGGGGERAVRLQDLLCMGQTPTTKNRPQSNASNIPPPRVENAHRTDVSFLRPPHVHRTPFAQHPFNLESPLPTCHRPREPHPQRLSLPQNGKSPLLVITSPLPEFPHPHSHEAFSNLFIEPECVCVCLCVCTLLLFVYKGQDLHRTQHSSFLFFPPTTAWSFPQVKHVWLLVGAPGCPSKEPMKGQPAQDRG